MTLIQLRERWGFPTVVNGNAARVVGGFVAVWGAAILALHAYAALPLMTLGFALRVISGPRLSPLALLATKVIVPGLKISIEPVAGAPKRFAQAIGLGVTSLASIFALALGSPHAADALLGVLVLFASLEAGFDLCVGCRIHAALVERGVFSAPPDVEGVEPASH